MNTSPSRIEKLEPNEVFVFGSNKAGKHFGGAAKHAHASFGAVLGKGIGLWGQSYAIPTLGPNFEKLPISEIQNYVTDFINFAKQRQDLIFLVTEIGTGIAGFSVEEMAELFRDAVDVKNIWLPIRFLEVID